MKKCFLLFTTFCLALSLIQCSKNDDSPAPEPIQKEEEETLEEPSEAVVLKGVFKDSEVEGLSYETATQSGITDAAGEFNYIEGEEVTFKVGNLLIGSALGQELITPITLAQTIDASATIESNLAQNIAALLQTLDEDGDESNGILITSEVAGNLGVENIDFTQPIESILGDIVLSVVINAGVDLSIVYPGDAANAMAGSLGISYEAPENFSLTSFIPTLKVYLESWDQGYTPPTALYKSTFDEMGNLMAIEVLSKYSGKKFFDFNFDAHTGQGLPTNGQWTRYWTNSLYGAFPSNLEFSSGIALTYNVDNQINTLDVLFDNARMNTEQFTAYDENNRPLAFFRDLAADNPDENFTITWNFTFDDEGQIATANRLFERLQTIDANNSIETVTTRDFTYTHDDIGNLNQVTYNRVFEDNIVTDGQPQRNVTSAMVIESFSYDASNKLTTFRANEEITPSNGDAFSVTKLRAYDNNETIVSDAYSTTRGFESNTTYENGVRTLNTSYQDGRITRSDEYLPNGGIIEKSYSYYDDGSIFLIQETEFDAGFKITNRILTYYNEDGSVWLTYDQDFDANGLLVQETGSYGNGEIFGVWYYDQNGFVVRFDTYFEGNINYYTEFEYDANGFAITATDTWPDGEVFGIRNFTYNNIGLTETVTYSSPDGAVYLTEIYEYDENNFLSKLSGYSANGTISYILYYENGVLITEEIYDENGNLVEVINHNTAGNRFNGSILNSKEPIATDSRRLFEGAFDSAVQLKSLDRKLDANESVKRHQLNLEKLPSQVSKSILKIRKNE